MGLWKIIFWPPLVYQSTKVALKKLFCESKQNKSLKSTTTQAGWLNVYSGLFHRVKFIWYRLWVMAILDSKDYGAWFLFCFCLYYKFVILFKCTCVHLHMGTCSECRLPKRPEPSCLLKIQFKMEWGPHDAGSGNSNHILLKISNCS